MTDIKICGLSTPETLDAAVDAGATHVGFVHFEKSPRHVTLEQASKLRRSVPESVKLVLVTVAMQPEPLARAYEAIRPDVIQFHGLWHVLSALAFGAYFIATVRPRNQEPST